MSAFSFPPAQLPMSGVAVGSTGLPAFNVNSVDNNSFHSGGIQNASNPVNFPLHLSSSFLGILSHPQLASWLQFALLGLSAELTRRYSKHIFHLVPYLSAIQVEVNPADEGYDWLMAWWVANPGWRDKCRRFLMESSRITGADRAQPWRIVNRRYSRHIQNRHEKPRPRFLPQLGQSYWCIYKNRLMRMTRLETNHGRSTLDMEALQIQLFFTWRRDLLVELLSEAKAAALRETEDKIVIRMMEDRKDGEWKTISDKNKRPLRTVLTAGNIAQQVLEDARQFLDAADWYSERGIPWRRGYLLEGVPGSGKTSLIHAIASELDLEIYVVSLAAANMTDASLNRALTGIPPGAIVIMEDIDVSMSSMSGEQSLNRNLDPETPVSPEGDGKKDKAKAQMPSRVTLSGLLNAIDGVGGSEGRLLFMTTNVDSEEKLDKALIRPGRADLTFRFTNATREVAKQLFRVFYPLEGKLPTKHARSVDRDCSSEKTLTRERMEELATEWSNCIEDEEFSTAALQGYLMMYRQYPGEAVDGMPQWTQSKRAQRREQEAAKNKRLTGIDEETQAKRDDGDSATQPSSAAISDFEHVETVDRKLKTG